ncbi:hypothetical protein Ae201684_008499 [Aphanomyces euteiches]|uniref:Uncharacterized protein n=1 Tax=Aphanomyces euteiches TaxID=100861 RepID=A0A6G0X4I8_9STRA|nr:hypothetical protein Ae201684_008499 [Aphanomyces euteiches]
MFRQLGSVNLISKLSNIAMRLNPGCGVGLSVRLGRRRVVARTESISVDFQPIRAVFEVGGCGFVGCRQPLGGGEVVGVGC